MRMMISRTVSTAMSAIDRIEWWRVYHSFDREDISNIEGEDMYNTFTLHGLKYLLPLILGLGAAAETKAQLLEELKPDSILPKCVSGSFIKIFCELVEKFPQLHGSYKKYLAFVDSIRQTSNEVPEYMAQIRTLRLKEYIYLNNLIPGKGNELDVEQTCSFIIDRLRSEENSIEEEEEELRPLGRLLSVTDRSSVYEKIDEKVREKEAHYSFYGTLKYVMNCSREDAHSMLDLEEFHHIQVQVLADSSIADLERLLRVRIRESISRPLRECYEKQCTGLLECSEVCFSRLPRVLIISTRSRQHIDSGFGQVPCTVFCPFLMNLEDLLDSESCQDIARKNTCWYQLVSVCSEDEEDGTLSTLIRQDNGPSMGTDNSVAVKKWFELDGHQVERSSIQEYVELGIYSHNVRFAVYEVCALDASEYALLKRQHHEKLEARIASLTLGNQV